MIELEFLMDICPSETFIVEMILKRDGEFWVDNNGALMIIQSYLIDNKSQSLFLDGLENEGIWVTIN